MQKIRYIKIENFKVFGKEIKINLGNPAVLIGPNNSGKTTVIQALALWSWGLKMWKERKGKSNPSRNINTVLNKVNIIQVPVKATRFFWTNAAVRKGKNDKIGMKITIGLFYKDKIQDCVMEFKYYNSEQILCAPTEETRNNESLISFANTIKIDLLYPMSGIDVEEPLIREGRINVLIGQGQTAQVLRNLCYDVAEKDKEHNTNNWFKICKIMKKLFMINLNEPMFNQTRGSLELSYTTNESQNLYPLDISLSGRGQQQILLLLAYLFTHGKSVLLIDEPDAHLEILRQKQIFSLLKKLANENSSQIIIATHSEVIVDEAIDTNLNLLIDGRCINISDKAKVKDTLKTFGIEHYYKAELTKSVIYVEGSTDIDMLKEFADILKHPLKELLEGTYYYYYTSDNLPEEGFEKDHARMTGSFLDYKKHFYSIKECVESFKGIAIFDSDNKAKTDFFGEDLIAVYWKKYELENYFVNEEVLLSFMDAQLSLEYPNLFQEIKLNLLEKAKEAFNEIVQEEFFPKDKNGFEAYNQSPVSLKMTIFNTLSSSKKMSKFLELFFEKFSQKTNRPIMLSKGEYYKMIQNMDPKNIDLEVVEKLDLIAKTLKKEVTE